MTDLPWQPLEAMEAGTSLGSERCVVAIGVFDGVHRGHGALLRTVANTARKLDATAAAFTFDRHPASVITGHDVPMLSGMDDRVS
jgi:riboflavin kinase/FMN adenylyltransferase